jgi:hypothetical protein
MDESITQFVCKRCEYVSSTKSNLKKHLTRKQACVPIDEAHNIETNLLLQELDTVVVYNEKTYDCEFCGRRFNSRSNKSTHRKVCKCNPVNKTALFEQTVLRKLVQEEICKQTQSSGTNHAEIVKKLKLELAFYKHKKKEKFYQELLEQYLCGTHKRLECGITDVTTDTLHAEIKQWDCWKEALGQLMAYNIEDAKNELHAYMFGHYSDTCKKAATKVMVKAGIKVYDLITDETSCSIVDQMKQVVHRFDV